MAGLVAEMGNRLLLAWGQGDESALDRLIPLLRAELLTVRNPHTCPLWKFASCAHAAGKSTCCQESRRCRHGTARVSSRGRSSASCRYCEAGCQLVILGQLRGLARRRSPSCRDTERSL